MHTRHLSPGDCRPGYMGMGSLTASSRISPEGSIRGHGMHYPPEYQNYNQGPGYGQPKMFQPPPPPPPPPLPHHPPPLGNDIFMEAGLLATEYLVSKGLLPPHVLPGKWQQNGSLKNQGSYFQGYRQQYEGGNSLPPEGRTSALARLGNNANFDAQPSMMNYRDEYKSGGSRNFIRGGRRRMGWSKGYGADRGREAGRNVLMGDRARASLDMEGGDSGFGHQEDREVGNHFGRGVQKSYSYEISAKRDNSKVSESLLDKSQFPEGSMSRKGSSSSPGKDLPPEDGAKLTTGCTEMKTSNEEMERQLAIDDDSIRHCAVEDDPISNNDKDPQSLCGFAEAMTNTCSSSIIKGPKVDSAPTTEQNHTDIGLTEELGVHNEDVSADMFPSQTQPLPVKPAEIAEELGSDYAIEQLKCTRSRSFSGGSFANEQKPRDSQPGLRISSSMVIDRGEKRALPLADNREGAKKSKEWLHSVVKTDEYTSMSNLGENQLFSQEGKSSSGEEVILVDNQESTIDMTLLHKDGAESGMDYAEEKQISSGSFKIFDLNLMEAPDEYDNHDTEQLIFPYAPESKRVSTPVDTGSSKSNNWTISEKFGKCGADGREVEVIDLENDSLQDDKAFDHSVRKAETELTGLEGFPNHVENSNDIQDAQNGYGLLMSELIGNDFSNCPLSPDVNSVHNVGGLHTGEEILGDDESIYMSLGDIPISMPDI